MQKSCDLLIVTFFGHQTVGFLPYIYRLRPLLTFPGSILVSNVTLDRLDFYLDDERFIHISNKNKGLMDTFLYLGKVISLINQLRPWCVVLMHSALAPLALWNSKSAKILYWNDHPLHTYPKNVSGKIRSIKRIKNRFMLMLSYAGARIADIVMPIGEAMRDDLLVNGCLPKRVKMIYMGVDNSFLPLNNQKPCPIGPIRRVLNVIYAGSIHPDRGLNIMLKSVAEVNADRTKVHLILVGAYARQYAHCLYLARKMEIENTVKVISRLPGSKIPPLLHKADAGICIMADTSYYQFNPPTKLFEYLAAGLPVLVNRIQTHTIYIQDGKTGIVFDYNAHSLSKAFDRLWREQSKLPQMKERALEEGKKYLWKRIEPGFIETVKPFICTRQRRA